MPDALDVARSRVRQDDPCKDCGGTLWTMLDVAVNDRGIMSGRLRCNRCSCVRIFALYEPKPVEGQ